MSLIAAVGCLMVKTGMLSTLASKSLSNLLLYFITPCVIFTSLQRDYLPSEGRLFFIMLLLSAGSFTLYIVCTQLLFPRKKKGLVGGFRVAVVLPNAGYLGIPLVQAVLGADGVFLLSAFMVCFQLLVFSYARFQLQKDAQELGEEAVPLRVDGAMIRQCILNPGTLSVLLGAVFYFAQIRLPGIVMQVAESVAPLNSVISMLLIGMFIAQSKLPELFAFPIGYLVSAVRLLLYPLLTMGALLLLPLSALVGEEGARLLSTTLIIIASTPSAVAASFLAELYGANYLYGTRYVVLTTLISVLTMPLMLMLWETLFAI